MTESTFRCLIVDDEPLAREIVATHIAGIPQLAIVAECGNAVEAMNVLRNEPIDLIFLDIQMPLLTGIDFLRSLSRPPKVILTTAYRDYALDAYDLDVVDYLLKPISFERFFKAIHKFLQLHSPATPTPPSTVNSAPSEELTMDFYANKKTYRVRLREILYIESLKDYVRVHLPDSRISSKLRISELEKELPDFFLRIHRSYIVNTHAITAFSSHELELGDLKLPIGSSYRPQVQNALQR